MKRIDSLVREVLKNLEPDIRIKRSSAMTLWESVAGSQLATFSKPMGFEGSVLIIRSFHPAATMEIRMRKKEILSRLNSLWEQEIFTDLKTVTRRNGR